MNRIYWDLLGARNRAWNQGYCTKTWMILPLLELLPSWEGDGHKELAKKNKVISGRDKLGQRLWSGLDGHDCGGHFKLEDQTHLHHYHLAGPSQHGARILGWRGAFPIWTACRGEGGPGMVCGHQGRLQEVRSPEERIQPHLWVWVTPRPGPHYNTWGFFTKEIELQNCRSKPEPKRD